LIAPRAKKRRTLTICAVIRLAVRYTVAFVLCVVPALAQEAHPPAVYDDSEAYQVYNVLLPGEGAFSGAQGTVVIEQDTTTRSLYRLAPEAATKFAEAIADFDHASGQTRLLQRQFEVPKPYELVKRDTIDGFFKEQAPRDGWKHFYERYPESGGFITLSAVGFNKSRTQAAVYIVTHSGPHGMDARLYLLEKRGDKWVQVQVGYGPVAVAKPPDRGSPERTEGANLR
jgi:hypothetical protein